MKTALKAKMIVPVAGPALRQGTLVFCDGRIADILPGHDVPFNGPVIDAKEDWVYPGFIDASSHLGVNPEPFDYLSESWDGADASAPLSPELLAADAFDPFSPALDAARAARQH